MKQLAAGNRQQATNNFLLTVACCLLTVSSHAANDAYFNYLQGMVEERAGNTAKALEAYEKAVQQDPQAVQVYRDIAELRMRLGQPDAALSAAEHVRELAPKDPSSYIFLGNVWVAQGNLAKAADAYEQALKLDPSNLRSLENLGNYYAVLDPEKALKYYDRYISLNPRDGDIYFQIAVVHQKKGRAAKAIEYYIKSIEQDPDQLMPHLALADLYEQQKSTALARAEYVAAAGLQPTNSLVLMRLANLLYREGKWNEAKTAFQEAGKASPEDPTVFYWQARIAEEKKDWKEAASNAEKAYLLSKDPQFLPLTAYYMTLDHQIENAIKYLEKARETDPDNANVLLFLGMNYLDQNKPEKARESLTRGVSLYPKDVQMRFQLGMTEDRLGNFEAAIAQFQEILKIDPKNAAAMNYIGYSWAERGMNLPEAEKLLRRVVAMEPESAAYMDSLGWVRYKRGDFDEARQYLEKAANRSADPLIYDHLGEAYYSGGKMEPALQIWSRALVLEPKNEPLRKKLLERGEAYLKTPESKKYFKYLEGNFKQVKNLSGSLFFRGRLSRRKLQTLGNLWFEQPDTMQLDIPATEKTAAVLYSVKGTTRETQPAPMNPILDQMALQGLDTLSRLLSGRLTDQLMAAMDSKSGIETRFSIPNASGGQDEFTVLSYDYVEGLWLPAELRVNNDTTGWSAEITISDWMLNDSHHRAREN